MAVKKQIAVVEVMCNTKQAVQMLDEYKRLATDTLSKIETKTKELNALKAKGAKATDQEKDRMKQLAKEIKADTAEFNKYNSATQKGIDSHRKLSQVMKDLSGSKLKDLKAALRDLNRMMGDVSNKTPMRAKVIQNAIAKVQGQINNLQTSTKTFGTTHNSVWQTAVRNITAYMGVMAGFNWVKTKILDVMKANREFSDQLANIRKVSGLAMSDINELANRLAKIDTRSTVQELNQLAYTGSKLGFGEYGIEGLESFVKSALKVQNALKEDMGEDAMTALSKMVEVMGLIPKMGVEKAMDATGSAIFKLASTSTATGSNIVEFSKRLMGLANQAGIATEELLAFGSAADSMALMPEVAATAFNKLITAVQKQPNLIENALHIEPGTISNMFQMGKMADAMVLIFEKMREKGGMNALMHSGVFKDLGSDGARLVGVMATMADRVDILNKHMETSRKAFKEATAVEMEYNIQMETAEAYMERAANLWTKAFVNPEGVDNVKSFAEAWYEVSKSLTENKLVMFELQLALQGLVLAFKGLMSILPAVLYALGTRGLIWLLQTLWPLMLGLITGTNGFSLALSKVRAQWAAMSVAMKANWISAAIGLLIQLSIYLVSTSDKLKEILGIETEAEKRMKALSNAYADAHTAADSAAKGLENYKKALDQANLSQREREGLINKFKNEFGVYLSYLHKEIKTVDDLRDAYADVVKVMKQKKLYEEREKYKQEATGERKTENRRTGVQIDEELKRLGVDTEKYNSSYFQKQFRADPAKLIGWMMRDQFAGAKEGKDEGIWVQNESNRRSYKSYNVRRLTELVSDYMEKARAIARDEEEADKMWANDLKGFDNDAFEQSKFESHVHTYDSLEDAPDKDALKKQKQAEQDFKQSLRKDLKDAKEESDAIISKIEEWYRLQESVITGMAADGKLTQEQAEQATRTLNIAKNTALRDARLAISGRNTEAWEKTKQQIGTLMIDQGEWSKELLAQILDVSMQSIRANLSRIDKGGGQFGITTSSLRDAVDKNAAGNQREINRILNKGREEVQKLLEKYDYLQQATRAFSDNLVKIGLLRQTAEQLGDELSAKKTDDAAMSLLVAMMRQGTNLYGVNPSDAKAVAANIAQAVYAPMTEEDYLAGRQTGKQPHWFDLFPEIKDWMENPEQHKKELEDFFNVVLVAEQDYYNKRKQSYDQAKRQQETRFRAAGYTDTEERADTQLKAKSELQDAGVGASFWRQQGLGGIANDPEVQQIQNRIYWRNKEVEDIEKTMEAKRESQQREVDELKQRQAEELQNSIQHNASMEQLEQLREQHRQKLLNLEAEHDAARMGMEDLLNEKKRALFEQETNLTTKVAQELQKRIQTINSLTKPVQDAANSVGKKLGEMIRGAEEESITWDEIWRNMAIAVGESVIDMMAAYAQNLIMEKAMNQQSKQESVEKAEVDVAAGIASGSAKTIGTLGWWGIALIPVIAALLKGLLSEALSTANKGNSSATKVKLVSGMLTYDEGNVGQYVGRSTEGRSLPAGRENVGMYVGNDGNVYHAKYQPSLPEGVSVVNQPIATTVNGQPALVGEKGPEIVIGRKTSRRIMMNEPGLLQRIAQIERGGRFFTRGGVRMLDSGNLDDVLNQTTPASSRSASPLGSPRTQEGNPAGLDGETLAALKALPGVLAALQGTLNNGIQARVAKYGDGSLDEGMREITAFRKKYPA